MNETRVMTRVWSGALLLTALVGASCTTIQTSTLQPPPGIESAKMATASPCNQIPTCTECTLRMNANRSATATGLFTSMQPGCYDAATIFGKTASFPQRLESANVPVPLLNTPYSAAVPVLTFVPATAYMCVYYPYGATHVEVCSVPFAIR